MPAVGFGGPAAVTGRPGAYEAEVHERGGRVAVPGFDRFASEAAKRVERLRLGQGNSDPYCQDVTRLLTRLRMEAVGMGISDGVTAAT